MALFRLPDEEPLAAYDSGLAQRLVSQLVHVLTGELGQSVEKAQSLAEAVTWSVTRESDGLWLNMDGIGVGGTWRSDEDGLMLYVRQLAYDLAVRTEDFEP